MERGGNWLKLRVLCRLCAHQSPLKSTAQPPGLTGSSGGRTARPLGTFPVVLPWEHEFTLLKNLLSRCSPFGISVRNIRTSSEQVCVLIMRTMRPQPHTPAQGQIWGLPQTSTQDLHCGCTGQNCPCATLSELQTWQFHLSCPFCQLTSLWAFYVFSYPSFPFTSLFPIYQINFIQPTVCHLCKPSQSFSEIKSSKEINTPKCFQVGFKIAYSCSLFR